MSDREKARKRLDDYIQQRKWAEEDAQEFKERNQPTVKKNKTPYSDLGLYMTETRKTLEGHKQYKENKRKKNVRLQMIPDKYKKRIKKDLWGIES